VAAHDGRLTAHKAERLEQWPIERVLPYANNPLEHDDEQLGRLEESIRTYGFVNPLLVDADTGELIAGHGRLLAARRVGLTVLPVIPLHGLNEHERRALRIADNRIAQLSTWNDERLRAELAALQAELPELPELGWTNLELQRLLEEPAARTRTLQAVDDVPELEREATSRAGDIWHLGDHRLLCGDGTAADTWAELLGDAPAAVLVTDPPGSLADNPDERGTFAAAALAALGAVLPRLRPRAPTYLWHAHRLQPEAAAAFEAHGLLLHQAIVWLRPAPAAIGYLPRRHEVASFGWRRGEKPEHDGTPRTTVWREGWDLSPGTSAPRHAGQRPVRLFEIPLELHTAWGEPVADPFAGTGTIFLAAERTRRRARGAELDPRMVDLTIRRWQAATGSAATLRGDGRTFAKLQRARRKGSRRG